MRALFVALGVVVALGTSQARADLIVLQSGGGGAGSGELWRFDHESGAPLASFGRDNEGYPYMSVTPQDEIYATNNILGLYAIEGFNRGGQYVADVAEIDQGVLAGVSRGRDGKLYCIMNDGASERRKIVGLDQSPPRVFVEYGIGGMSFPTWMIFGPDGHLYVADRDAGILRFNGSTGVPMGVFVPLGRGGLVAISRMVFGPDGRLYVSTDTGSAVLRFDGATGAFIDTFVGSGSGGLSTARGLAFGPDGNLYVASRETHQVLRYHGNTGAYAGVGAAGSTMRFPSDIGFTTGQIDSVWFDDALPAGAVPSGEPWQWVSANPEPWSGSAAHRGTFGPGFHEHWFNFAHNRMDVRPGDTLFVHVFVEDADQGAEIMLSWCDESGWEHRAYWGANVINAGTNNTASRRFMGPLPGRGTWIQLQIPAARVGLEGHSVQGMAFTTNNVRVTFDRIGKMNVGSVSTPDTISPTVSITAPAAGATVSGNMTITATGGDNVGVNRVEFALDGSDRFILVDNPASPYTTTWDTRFFSNGSHTITLTARDAAGNQASDSRTINVQNTDDVTRPNVTITSPANNAAVSGIVTVNASASDNVGVQRVEFEIYGAIIATDTSAPYSATWDSRNLPDGNYMFIVRAYDAAGHMSAATASIATSNSTPPPPPPPPTGGAEIVWSDDAFPAGAWGGASGGDAWNWVTANPTPFSGNRAHQSANVPGIHEHYFNEAADRLSIQTGDLMMAYVYIDPANPPQALMLSWNDGSSWDHRAYWGANVIPYGKPNSVGRVRAGDLPAAGGWVRLQVSAALVGLEGRSVSGLSFIASNGRATWDRVGKIVAASSPPPPPGDTTPPTVSVLAPANNATVSGSIQLSARAADNQLVTSVQIRVDGVVLATSTSSGASVDFAANWNTQGVANGNHILTAVATDSAGNQTTSAGVTVTVSNGSKGVMIWMDGAVPAGASTGASGGDAWNWVTTSTPPSPSGSPVHQSNNVGGLHEHSFNFAWDELEIASGDALFVYVLIDPANPPQQIMLSWCDGSTWEHRAYWGANLINEGQNNTASRRYMGPIPASGAWVQLQIPASQIGLVGQRVQGMSFGLFGGRASWDTAGKAGP